MVCLVWLGRLRLLDVDSLVLIVWLQGSVMMVWFGNVGSNGLFLICNYVLLGFGGLVLMVWFDSFDGE